MLYLDHAATTVVRPEVRDAMAPFLDDAFGNPSGIHGVSRRAKNAMEEARERLPSCSARRSRLRSSSRAGAQKRTTWPSWAPRSRGGTAPRRNDADRTRSSARISALRRAAWL